MTSLPSPQTEIERFRDLWWPRREWDDRRAASIPARDRQPNPAPLRGPGRSDHGQPVGREGRPLRPLRDADDEPVGVGELRARDAPLHGRALRTRRSRGL